MFNDILEALLFLIFFSSSIKVLLILCSKISRVFFFFSKFLLMGRNSRGKNNKVLAGNQEEIQGIRDWIYLL